MESHCEHEALARDDVNPRASGCEECLHSGSAWVELRLCLTCGHVGCSDTSVNRHAKAHFEATGHPIVQAFGDGARWRYCYEHDRDLGDGRELPPPDEQPFV